MTTDRGRERGTSNQGIRGDSLKGYKLKEREGYDLKVLIYYKNGLMINPILYLFIISFFSFDNPIL